MRRTGAVLVVAWACVGMARGQPLPAGPDPFVVDAAVDRAVLFLARRQVPPGATGLADAGAFGADRHPVALTALSVLALLSAGHTEDDGRFGLVLLRAGDFLLARVPDDGYYGRLDGSRMYGQALATLALAELSAQAFSPERRARYLEALRRAVAVLVAAQQVERDARHAGGWRYEPESTDADLSVTAWCVLALSTARRVGVEVPDKAFARAAAYAMACQVRQGDEVGFGYQPGSALSPGATASGMLVLGLTGRQGVSEWDRSAAAAAAESIARRPVRFEDRFVYYVAHASMVAANHADASSRRQVRAWATPLLLSLQQEDGGLPTSRTGEEPGRVYATAMAILTLTAPNGVLLSHQP